MPRPSVLRFLHWNTWMIPDPLISEHMGGLDNDMRLPHIAARLNTGLYDVVTLNEVFSGAVFQEGPQSDLIYLLSGYNNPHYENVDVADLEARYALLEPLAGAPAIQPTGQYPYWAWVPGLLLDYSGDAGLAFFSKFPPLHRENMPCMATIDYLDNLGVSFFCLCDAGETAFYQLQQKAEQQWDDENPDGSTPDIFTERAFARYCDEFGSLASNRAAGAFAFFEQAAGDDAMAIKGAAWFRVLNGKTGQPLNIIVTHTQADYPENDPPEDHSAVRNGQMRTIEKFIEQVVPIGEDVVLCGDLNVLGDGGHFVEGPLLQNPEEYDKQVLQRFGNLGLQDTFRTQLRDVALDKDGGFTRDRIRNLSNAQDPYNQRLDYILARWSKQLWFDNQKCVQHVRVRRDFDLYPPTIQAGSDISDHYPVEVTVGMDRGYPSPKAAFDVGSVPAQVSVMELKAEFSQPGALQWIRIPAFTDLLGTADQAVPSDKKQTKSDLLLELFAAHDISMPLQPFGGSAVQGLGGVRDYPNGIVVTYPFDTYIRVSTVAPKFEGTAKIRLVRLDGNTFDTAIPIEISGFPTSIPARDPSFGQLWTDAWSKAATFVGADLPGQTGQQTLWFRFNAEVIEPSVPHALTVTVLQDHQKPFNASPRSYYVGIYDNANLEMQGFGNVPITIEHANSTKPYQLSMSGAKVPALKFSKPASGWRLAVKRGAASNAAEKIRLNVTTNVRGARFQHFNVFVGNDPGALSGNEEPAGLWTVDNQVYRMKAWQIEIGGGFSNWSWNIDHIAMPQGASQHDIHFKKHWQWEIGESSMEDDTEWDADSVEWFRGDSLNGIKSFTFHPTGVVCHANQSQYSPCFGTIQLTRQTPSQTCVWTYYKYAEFPTPTYKLYCEVYIPGGICTQSDA